MTGDMATGLLKEELNIDSVNARRTLVQAVCREIEGLVRAPLCLVSASRAQPRCPCPRPAAAQALAGSRASVWPASRLCSPCRAVADRGVWGRRQSKPVCPLFCFFRYQLSWGAGLPVKAKGLPGWVLVPRATRPVEHSPPGAACTRAAPRPAHLVWPLTQGSDLCLAGFRCCCLPRKLVPACPYGSCIARGLVGAVVGQSVDGALHIDAVPP